MISDEGPISGARASIIDAARGLIASAGWGAAGSAQVATIAGVSKALVHYHFHNSRTLLIAVAASCRKRISDRTSDTAPIAQHYENPVDDFAEWLDIEIESADLRIALQLSLAPGEDVQRAAGEVRALYRAAAERRILGMFAALELSPRISDSLVVDLVVCMSEGMAIGRSGSHQVVEALCLSLLTLAD